MKKTFSLVIGFYILFSFISSELKGQISITNKNAASLKVMTSISAITTRMIVSTAGCTVREWYGTWSRPMPLTCRDTGSPSWPGDKSLEWIDILWMVRRGRDDGKEAGEYAVIFYNKSRFNKGIRIDILAIWDLMCLVHAPGMQPATGSLPGWNSPINRPDRPFIFLILTLIMPVKWQGLRAQNYC